MRALALRAVPIAAPARARDRQARVLPALRDAGDARSVPHGRALRLPMADDHQGNRPPGRRGPPMGRHPLPAAAMADPPAGMPIHRARSTRCPMTAHEMNQ